MYLSLCIVRQASIENGWWWAYLSVVGVGPSLPSILPSLHPSVPYKLWIVGTISIVIAQRHWDRRSSVDARGLSSKRRAAPILSSIWARRVRYG